MSNQLLASLVVDYVTRTHWKALINQYIIVLQVYQGLAGGVQLEGHGAGQILYDNIIVEDISSDEAIDKM